MYTVSEPHGKYPGLPPLVDRRTAEAILRMRPEMLEAALTEPQGPDDLSMTAAAPWIV